MPEHGEEHPDQVRHDPEVRRGVRLLRVLHHPRPVEGQRGPAPRVRPDRHGGGRGRDAHERGRDAPPLSPHVEHDENGTEHVELRIDGFGGGGRYGMTILAQSTANNNGLTSFSNAKLMWGLPKVDEGAGKCSQAVVQVLLTVGGLRGGRGH